MMTVRLTGGVWDSYDSRMPAFLTYAGILASVLVLVVVSPTARASQPTPLDETLIPVMTPAGVTILAELADTAEKRARGLMFRDTLAKDRGMLFTFGEPQQW